MWDNSSNKNDNFCEKRVIVGTSICTKEDSIANKCEGFNN